jgi:aspartyl-tRNA(Asn)/glutamyl-tRNA(Gln) amidotransferase subunit A
MVPIALGSDTGGSVRTPAALCGITGHKTTLGEVGRGGVLALAESFDTVGTLARSAQDAALVFDALRGADTRDHATGRSQQVSRLVKKVANCRIVIAEGALFDQVNPEIVNSVYDLGCLLEDLGANVERREVAMFSEVQSLSERDDLISAEAWRNNAEILQTWGESRDWLTDWILEGKAIDYRRLSECRSAQARMQADFVDASEGIDAFISPTVRATARPISVVDADFAAHVENYLSNTIVGNFLNLCGLAVPTGTDTDGLPMGAMILGKPFGDTQVLAIGQALEASGNLPELKPDLSSFD